MLWKMRIGLAPRRPKKISASARSRTPTASVPNRIARPTASSYPTHPGDAARRGARQNRRMSNTTLLALSNELSTLVDGAAPSVVQVQGRRRTASGVALGDDAVVTMVRAIGRDETLRVRRHDDQTIDAELVGWDPATGLAVLRAPGLGVTAARHSDAPVRVGHLAVAVARSWSNVGHRQRRHRRDHRRSAGDRTAAIDRADLPHDRAHARRLCRGRLRRRLWGRHRDHHRRRDSRPGRRDSCTHRVACRV